MRSYHEHGLFLKTTLLLKQGCGEICSGKVGGPAYSKQSKACVFPMVGSFLAGWKLHTGFVGDSVVLCAWLSQICAQANRRVFFPSVWQSFLAEEYASTPAGMQRRLQTPQILRPGATASLADLLAASQNQLPATTSTPHPDV